MNRNFEYTAYNRFTLPLPNQQNKWMKAIHTPFIEVNIDAGTYMTLDSNWYNTLKCEGQNNLYCKAVITEQNINNFL